MAIDHHLPRARGQLKTAGEQLLEQGRNEGRHEGRAKGRVEGLVEGLVEGRVEVLRRLLTRRFGALPTNLDHQLTHATQEQLDVWTDRILDAGSLSDLFAGAS
jgi:flagellar biosynthesis/type III secretory pathway protein FliH